jgi:serine/threonine protein kinase
VADINPHALPEGTLLQEFEILSLIGAGGFGIVYLAMDRSLERHIAIKEYMPSQFAFRPEGTTTITVRTNRDLETFEVGLRSFINEARLLAQFDHPALVKVHRFWQDNGTAYMAMRYYEGLTLKQTLAKMRVPPDEQWLRSLLNPLLDACETLHQARCFHRDIAPDNILIGSGGPVLLDFGAARRVISDSTKTLTVILKEGYAPIEQYGNSRSLVQGPWTDIYALSGVIRFAMTGKPPPPSIDRLIEERMLPLTELCRGRYSDGFLAAIDAGLALKPADRPQDIGQLRHLLDASLEARARINSDRPTVLRSVPPSRDLPPDFEGLIGSPEDSTSDTAGDRWYSEPQLASNRTNVPANRDRTTESTGDQSTTIRSNQEEGGATTTDALGGDVVPLPETAQNPWANLMGSSTALSVDKAEDPQSAARFRTILIGSGITGAVLVIGLALWWPGSSRQSAAPSRVAEMKFVERNGVPAQVSESQSAVADLIRQLDARQQEIDGNVRDAYWALDGLKKRANLAQNTAERDNLQSRIVDEQRVAETAATVKSIADGKLHLGAALSDIRAQQSSGADSMKQGSFDLATIAFQNARKAAEHLLSEVANISSAVDAQTSCIVLLRRAQGIIDANSGNANAVLLGAREKVDQALKALAGGEAIGARDQFAAATATVNSEVTGFLDQLIANYSLIAQRKMAANDLQTAQAAISKAKELKKLEGEFK